jgi:hypothetical protein
MSSYSEVALLRIALHPAFFVFNKKNSVTMG